MKCVISTQSGCSRKKTDAEGNVELYKARMVACGNEKDFGKKYILTSTTVMDMTTRKDILELRAIWGVPAHHGDVPNAYVKASTEPDLDIYLYEPQGMKVREKEIQRCGAQDMKQVVLRLQRSLYEQVLHS